VEPQFDPRLGPDGACRLLQRHTCANAGVLANTTAPKTGKAAFAADLKNSRRDCNSSLFLLFSITL
jgi:hypothetical protein